MDAETNRHTQETTKELHDVGLKYPNTCLVDGQRDDRVAVKVDVTVYIVYQVYRSKMYT